MVSSSSGNALEVIFLNGFEDSAFRRDYYKAVQQEWQAEGIHTTVDTLVTLEDLAKLEKYDVFVFSMHGSLYEGSPVLCLNEIASSATDKKYIDYLNHGSVAKVYTTRDHRYHYWVFPDFFTQCYDSGALDGKVCWSESCDFFGDDRFSAEPDTSFADALLQVSCEAVLGYRNSVGAEYSRNVMKYSLEVMFAGTEVQFALDSAMVTQGHTDGWEDLSEGKRAAYPLRYGNLMYIVAKPDDKLTLPDSTIPVSDIFDETYWYMSFGQSLGYNYVAKFSADGTFVARGMGSGAYENGTYTYSNGKLVIVFDIDGFGYPSTIEYSGNKDGFTSLDKYPMQVGEDFYTLNPDDGSFFDGGIESDPATDAAVLSDGEYYGYLQSWNQNSMTIELYEFLGWNEMYMYREFEQTGKTVTLDTDESSVWLEWPWGETGNDVKCKSIDAALNTEIWGGGTTVEENCTFEICFVVKNGAVEKIVLLYAS